MRRGPHRIPQGVLENLRDRRVILSAFFFGVLLAPLIFALTTTIASKRVVRNQDKPLQLSVAGGEHAPNLLRFLSENGVEVSAVELSADEAIESVRRGEHDLVLLIDAAVRREAAPRRAGAVDLWSWIPRTVRRRPAPIARVVCSKRTDGSSRRFDCSCAASVRR